VQVGAYSIEYILITSRRRSLAIQVKPDAAVIVRAPHGTTPARADALIAERIAWIVRHRARFLAASPVADATSPHADGAPLLFLGVPCTLTLTRGAKTSVMLTEDRLTVTLPDPGDSSAVAAAIERWLHRQAIVYFGERLIVWSARTAALGIPAYDKLTVRAMRTRWGTCSSARRVTLNSRLIHLDPALIDYVIAHELCHLQIMNHSRTFWALLSRLLPDWKARRTALHRVRLM